MRQNLTCLSIALLLSALLAGCGGSSTPAAEDRLQVVTTIYPLDYMVSRIGGSDVEAHRLIGPGAEAHAFEPTSSDVQRLSQADLVVANGLDLEPWLGRIIEGFSTESRPRVVEAADIPGLEPLDGDDHDEHDDEALDEEGHEEEQHEDEDDHAHETDPHLWLDPVLAQAQAERIRDAMIEADPDAAQGYTDRARDLIDELAAIHDEYVAGLASCAHHHFVTTHGAYGYVAKRYGLEQISISGISLEAEPTPRDLADLTTQVRELGLRYVLVEPAVGSRLADTVAAEGNLELVTIHQMESVTEQELADHGDYLGLMRDNLSNLKIALECGG